MEYNQLGNTGINLPSIIFGTSALGNLYTDLDDNSKLSIVRECFRHMPGPVAFDSAGKYGAGMALEKLGEKLHALTINNDQVVISNKLGWLQTPLTDKEPKFEKGVWININHDAKQAISYEGILKCWHQGNRLLGNDYLPQLVSVHDPDEYIHSGAKSEESLFKDILEGYRALEQLKAEGKVKAIGIGAKDWKIIRSVAEYIELDWVMFANSLTVYTHPTELIRFMDELNKKNIFIINSAVFNAGFLIGGSYFNYKLIDIHDPVNRELVNWRYDFMQLCRDYSLEPARVCIHFGRSHPAVRAVALNTSKPERVKWNIDAIETDVPAEFYHDMRTKGLIDKKYPYV